MHRRNSFVVERKRVISCDMVCPQHVGPNVSGHSEHPKQELLCHGSRFPSLFYPGHEMPQPRLLQYYLELVDDV